MFFVKSDVFSFGVVFLELIIGCLFVDWLKLMEWNICDWVILFVSIKVDVVMSSIVCSICKWSVIFLG